LVGVALAFYTPTMVDECRKALQPHPQPCGDLADLPEAFAKIFSSTATDSISASYVEVGPAFTATGPVGSSHLSPFTFVKLGVLPDA